MTKALKIAIVTDLKQDAIDLFIQPKWQLKAFKAKYRKLYSCNKTLALLIEMSQLLFEVIKVWKRQCEAREIFS